VVGRSNCRNLSDNKAFRAMSVAGSPAFSRSMSWINVMDDEQNSQAGKQVKLASKSRRRNCPVYVTWLILKTVSMPSST
jgi:hypothetical protein